MDFEQWLPGTAGWVYDQAYLSRHDEFTVGAHFSSFEFDIIGWFYVNHTSTVVFNTSDVSVQYWAQQCGMYAYINPEATTTMADPDIWCSDVDPATGNASVWDADAGAFVQQPASDPAQTRLCFNISTAPLDMRNSTGAYPGDACATGGCNERGEFLCWTWHGVVAFTATGSTEVAVFNFREVYLGPQVHVVLQGVRALAILSRSSVYLDTPLIAPPGQLGVRHCHSHTYTPPTLRQTRVVNPVTHSLSRPTLCPQQAFDGARLQSPYGTNVNGAGSGSKRVYLQTIITSATDVDEVQRITTTAATGQTLGGSFQLEYKGDVTHPIRHDATPRQVQSLTSRLSHHASHTSPPVPSLPSDEATH